MPDDIEPVVHLGYASYRGRQTATHTIAYLGIPYAEPPIGARRFRKPLPLKIERLAFQSPANVFDATQYPAFALQGSTGESQSDDWTWLTRDYSNLTEQQTAPSGIILM